MKKPMKSIPRLPKQVSGGALDDRIPEPAVKLIQELEGETEEIADRIGNEIGWYRLMKQSQATAPQVAELLNHLGRMHEASRFLHDSIRDMPLELGARMRDKIYSMGGDEFLSLDSLNRQLIVFNALTNYAAKEITPYRGRTGDKKNGHEHQLLSHVAEILEHRYPQMKLEEAAGTAAAIVSNVCVVPTEPKKARAAIRKFRGSGWMKKPANVGADHP